MNFPFCPENNKPAAESCYIWHRIDNVTSVSYQSNHSVLNSDGFTATKIAEGL